MQEQRLGPRFARLTAAFEANRLRAVADPAAQAPEYVLVLDVAGELNDFAAAMRRVPGLEFLAEEIEDKIEPDDFAVVDRDGRRKPYDRLVYVVASDLKAWEEILSLYGRFQRREPFQQGTTPFRHLFGRLRDLRPWDDRDRLELTGVLRAWNEELEGLDEQLVEFEAELWFRSDADLRRRAIAELRRDLEAQRGELVDESVVAEIGYHGALGRVPARLLREVVREHRVRWMRTGAVRFFHAVGQIAAPADDLDVDAEGDGAAPVTAAPTGQPRIALLDGLPLGNHERLRGRVIIDDPDEWDATTPVNRRVHGTGMASVVLSGDLNTEGPSFSSPLYVRPILKAEAPDWVANAPEELPRNELPVDLIHRAVARLFERENPVAPEVRAVLLAVGDRSLQFSTFVSPLARLLDWLSFRYGIVFLVSAGNHLESLSLPEDVDADDPAQLQHEVVCALQREAAFRRLLSPAESVNALTIGAAHSDWSSVAPDDGRVDPFSASDFSNVSSALGSGVRRAIKPDVLFPGGRELVRIEPATDDGARSVSLVPTRRPPGIRMAAPGHAGNLRAMVFSTGTSLATAMSGYYAGHVLDRLAWLRSIHGDRVPDSSFDAVLLKAALVHGARWGQAHAAHDIAQQELQGRRNRDTTSRMVGYGRSEAGGVLICDDHRVTVIAANPIVADDEHVYQFPLPPSLASNTERRRVAVTLAWLTPISSSNRLYRRAALKAIPLGLRDFFGARSDTIEHSSRRGTVQHDVFEGRRAVPFAPGASIDVVVSCREDAPSLDVPVPYALMVTLEVPEAVNLSIYSEVRQALRAPVGVRQRG